MFRLEQPTSALHMLFFYYASRFACQYRHPHVQAIVEPLMLSTQWTDLVLHAPDVGLIDHFVTLSQSNSSAVVFFRIVDDIAWPPLVYSMPASEQQAFTCSFLTVLIKLLAQEAVNRSVKHTASKVLVAPNALQLPIADADFAMLCQQTTRLCSPTGVTDQLSPVCLCVSCHPSLLLICLLIWFLDALLLACTAARGRPSAQLFISQGVV